MNKIENGLVWVEVTNKKTDHKITLTADYNYCKCCNQLKWVVNCVQKEKHQTKIWTMCFECHKDTCLEQRWCICCNPSTSFNDYNVCDECAKKMIENTQELYQICNKPSECDCRFCKHLS